MAEESQVTIDATDKPLGRLASEIAKLLQGKDDPSFEPHKPGTTSVVVENIRDMELSGNKKEQKIYRTHTTQRAGRLKKKTFEQAFEEDPEWVLKHAVAGMLPKNRLRDKRLKRLSIKEEVNEDQE